MGEILPDLCQKLLRRAHTETVESPQKVVRAIAKRTWRRQEDAETVLKGPLKLQTAHKVHEASQRILCEC